LSGKANRAISLFLTLWRAYAILITRSTRPFEIVDQENSVMKIRPILMFCNLLVILLLLTGCERPASVAPTLAEETKPVAFATATSNPAQIMIAQTQTAAAGIPQATETPASVKITSTQAPSGSEANSTPVALVVTMTPTTPGAVQTTIISVPTLKVPVSYTIKEFESPYCIARRFNIDIGEFLSTNKLTTESRPPAGTTLYMPGTGHRWSSGDRALLAHPTTYTVKTGDTLSKVACLYGDVSPEAIIVLNNLQEPYKLSAGQVLQIP
jgi:LysM repeat protein